MGFQTMAGSIMTINRMIQNEVRLCLSGLVQTLGSANGLIEQQTRNYSGAKQHNDAEKELMSLCEQAAELCAPVDDWEEAARQEGWTIRPETVNEKGIKSDACIVRGTTQADAEYANGFKYAENWQEACESDDLEPYQWEVYEHWAVSQWLGDKLMAHGEKVDDDFAGHVVWARTSTGQGIACDGVMQRIFESMMEPAQ